MSVQRHVTYSILAMKTYTLNFMLFNETSLIIFSFPQPVERRPLFFICPSFKAGPPREFPQRDPRDVLLPGGGDIPQPRLADQLSLRSSCLYEESLLQYWDHVSKRNKFVEPTRRPGYTVNYYVSDWIWTCAGNQLHRSLDMQMHYFKKTKKKPHLWFRPVGRPVWMELRKDFHQKWKRTTCPRLPPSKGDTVQKT